MLRNSKPKIDLSLKIDGVELLVNSIYEFYVFNTHYRDEVKTILYHLPVLGPYKGRIDKIYYNAKMIHFDTSKECRSGFKIIDFEDIAFIKLLEEVNG